MSRQATVQTQSAAKPTITPIATGVLLRQCACGQHTSAGGECKECKKKHEGTLQRAAINPSPVHDVPPIVHEVLRSPGQPLDLATRTYMEPRFGHDFSRVRVHTDAKAAESARTVNALAYTVGSHIAFKTGNYAPGMDEGKRLLAHELAHIVQQRGAGMATQAQLAIGATSTLLEHEAEAAAQAISSGKRTQLTPLTAANLQRQWDTPTTTECNDIPPDTWLEKVVVEQELPQHVTLFWSNGSLEAGICSTGKGHCCIDPTSPDGVGCSVSESRRDGSNCTPITSGRGERITDRYRAYNGWRFWNTFVPSRGVALHQHHTVSGSPLSHGCVRLHEDTARHIFCGARQDITRVEVRGFARPFCGDPQLRQEWQGDFSSAARSSDGEPPDKARIIRRNRRESRRILNEAYSRTLSEAEISGGLNRLDIPTCSTTQDEPNTEERRLLPDTGAASNVPTDPVHILATSRFERFIPQFSGALEATRGFGQARRTIAAQGNALWQAATARAQATTSDSDDRPLYWARLGLTRILRQWQPTFRLSNAQRTELLALLERTSRGMESVRFDRDPVTKRILVSGFDPFGLDIGPNQDIRHSNPSGAAALSLDGRRLTNGMVTAEVQAVIFPVRFADFDAGFIERFFQPFLTGPNAVDMIMTISQGISQGISDDFEVEEFAGRRRATNFADNLGVLGGGSPTGPVVPPGLTAGPEFLPTSLPTSIRHSLGRTAPTPGEREITEIPAQGTSSTRGLTGPSTGSTAVAGSGGSFLSNEIFYRTMLLRTRAGVTIPVGHLHTPPLPPLSSSGITGNSFAQVRSAIVQRIERILNATLPDL